MPYYVKTGGGLAPTILQAKTASGLAAARASRSNLPWASGATVDSFGASTFSTYRGIPLDIQGVSQPYDTWTNLTANNFTFSSVSGFTGRLAIAFAGLPGSLSGTAVNTSLDAIVAGTYDTNYTSFINMLISYGRQTSIIRLMWEFNANTAQPWLTTQTSDSTRWKNAWNHIAALFKAACPTIQMCYNPASGNTGISGVCGSTPMATYYPGNTYCDIIGTDSYDFYDPATNSTTWTAQKAKTGGINDAISLAASNSKLWAVPEWGLISPDSDGHEGGDNTYYITQMAALFGANASTLAFENYYDTTISGTASDICQATPSNPNSAATYKTLYTAAL